MNPKRLLRGPELTTLGLAKAVGERKNETPEVLSGTERKKGDNAFRESLRHSLITGDSLEEAVISCKEEIGRLKMRPEHKEELFVLIDEAAEAMAEEKAKDKIK